MAPRLQTSELQGTNRVRARLLTDLHIGRLSPGDRVVSVRRLADLTGMNHKTIHRAYRTLAREGLLEVRPGSGTFVRQQRTGSPVEPAPNDLLLSLNRSRAEAAGLGLAPPVYARLLQIVFEDGLRGVPVVVAECNREQTGLIAADLRTALGLDVRETSLTELQADPARVVGERHCVVTTDCHWSEIKDLADVLGRPIYTVALDADFPRTLSRHAEHGPVVMLVRDRSFAPVFRRLLTQLGVGTDALDRLVVVEPRLAATTFRRLEHAGVVYVSPLLSNEPASRVPNGWRRIPARWHIGEQALERLRASLALSVALSTTAPPARPGSRLDPAS